MNGENPASTFCRILSQLMIRGSMISTLHLSFMMIRFMKDSNHWPKLLRLTGQLSSMVMQVSFLMISVIICKNVSMKKISGFRG